MSGAMAAAEAAWGEAMPDWVRALATACEATSQNRVAKRLGKSAALISNVLHNRYGAGLDNIEEMVRGVFLAETVSCPAQGVLSTAKCQEWRAKARNFSNGNAERVRMFRACKRCVIYAAKEGS